MAAVKLFCLCLIFDIVVSHVIHDDVKKERIHFPTLSDYSRTKRQAEQADPALIAEVFGSGNEEVLDSSNGFGLGQPTQNQDALNGNVPTTSVVEIPVTVNPTSANNPSSGANVNNVAPSETVTNSPTSPRDQTPFPDAGTNWGNMNNNPMMNPARRVQPNMPNYGLQYPQRQPDYNNEYNQQNAFKNNPFIKKTPVAYTTNTNAAVNLGFGLPKDNPVVPVKDNADCADPWGQSNDHYHNHRPRNHRGHHHRY